MNLLERLNPFAVSGLLTWITFLPLAVFIWKRSTNKVAYYFGWHIFTAGMWGVGAFLIGLNFPKIAWYLWSYSYAIVLFIPVTLMHSVLHMTGNKYIRPIMVVCYGQAVILAGACLFDSGPYSMLHIANPRFMFDQYTVYLGTPLYITSFVLWQTVVGSANMILLWHYIKRPEQKQMLKILFLAIAIGFGGGTTNFFQIFGWNFYPWGNFGVSVYTILIGYTILQHKFLDITFVLRKGLVYTLLIGMISVFYFVTILLFEPVISRFIGQGGTASGLLAAIILGVVYAPMRLRIEYFVDATIFRGYHQQITRQNQLMQEELSRSKKFGMMSDITKGVISEIAVPLQEIRSRSQSGLSKLDDKEYMSQVSQTIDQQVDKINDLVQKLLKFSTPEALALKHASIHNVIEDVLEIMKKEFEQKKIELVKDLQTKESEILTIDPVQIRQAFYNLMKFGAEDMKGGGTMVVHTGVKHASLVRQEKRQEGVEKYFEMVIKDSGAGIPKERLATIFDPFYGSQAKAGEDSGLELSIAHRIIKDHGGAIYVESGEGKGTTFTVEIPVKR